VEAKIAGKVEEKKEGMTAAKKTAVEQVKQANK